MADTNSAMPGASTLEALRRQADAERTRGAAFILETRQPQTLADVERVARSRFGAGSVTEPLFPSRTADPQALSHFFLTRLPGLRFTDLPRTPYDWAYAVRDRDEFFRSVEPDLAIPLQPPADPSGFESSDGMCFLDAGLASSLQPNWSLQQIDAPGAWALPLPAGGKAKGEGIRIAHLDTGRADHQALPADAFDPTGQYDFYNEDADPTDPLDLTWSSGLYPEHPGHGTATGSVIAGRGGAGVLGVAPMAKLVTLRCVRSVIITTTASTVARAIVHAADNNCHVISMSLGGLPRRALQRAVEYAVSRNVIVGAAAGNCVRYVVAPAVYSSCIAVGGINHDFQPWFGSCRGSAVAVSAPGEFVWCATRKPDDLAADGAHLTAVRPGQGTSFAVANVAGSAACWLAFHGRDQLLSRYSGTTLQQVFRSLLRTTAEQHRPANWDTANFGAGPLNLRALLAAPLPPSAGGFEAAMTTTPETYSEVLAKAAGPQWTQTVAPTVDLETVGAELADMLYQSQPVRGGGFESARAGEPLRDQIRSCGSAKLRRLVP